MRISRLKRRRGLGTREGPRLKKGSMSKAPPLTFHLNDYGVPSIVFQLEPSSSSGADDLVRRLGGHSTAAGSASHGQPGEWPTVGGGGRGFV